MVTANLRSLQNNYLISDGVKIWKHLAIRREMDCASNVRIISMETAEWRIFNRKARVELQFPGLRTRELLLGLANCQKNGQIRRRTPCTFVLELALIGCQHFVPISRPRFPFIPSPNGITSTCQNCMPPKMRLQAVMTLQLLANIISRVAYKARHPP